MDNFNLGAFHILFGEKYHIESLFPLVSIKKIISASTTTSISLSSKILNTPSFLGDININIKDPLADLLYVYFTINNQRIPQPLIETEIYGYDLKENENFITLNKLLSEKPRLEMSLINNNAYALDITIELYLIKIQLKSKKECLLKVNQKE